MAPRVNTLIRLRSRLSEWAAQHHGDDLAARMRDYLGDQPPQEDLVLQAVAFALLVRPAGGTSLVDRYVAAGHAHSRAERDVLRAWREARITALHVLDVELDRGLHVRDVLHDERLFLPEKRGTHQIRPGTWLFAAICCFDRTWELDGASLVLGPRARIRVVQALLASDPLEAVRAYHRAFRPPRLVNSEGHSLAPVDLVLDTDLETVRRLAEDWADARVEPEQVALHSPPDAQGGSYLRGSIRRLQGEVLLSVNSKEREEELLARLDGIGVLERREAELPPNDPDGEEMIVDFQAFAGGVDEVMASLNDGWADFPIEALGGQTPREALEAGRIAEVRALAPDDADVDFWHDLGLEP